MERNALVKLVTRAQKGDSTAMDELFANFYNDVYYFALKTVKDADLACDITQETFLEIIRTIGSLKEPAAFVTWMKQITYHQCTRYFKKKKDVLVDEDEDGNTIFDTLADESEGSIPAEVYEKEEFRSTILGIINELTEEQRSAVMMYYFDELPVNQIAQIQGVSDGTVKSRLNYARKAIKKSVEDYEKKHNIKLHSFSFLPLFLLFFGKELMPAAKAAEIGAAVSAAAGAAGTGAAAAAVGGAAAKTGFAAKLASLPVVTKIVAGITAAAIAVGGGAALVNSKAERVEPCVDENYDCICDVCSAGIHLIDGEQYVGEVAHDAFCDNCSISLGFLDENEDWICDECGEYPCGAFHHNGHWGGDIDDPCGWCGYTESPPPELKTFDLQIEDGILHIVYPDGEADPNVDYYEIRIGELGIVETVSGTEFDLNTYEYGDCAEVAVEVIGVNEKYLTASGGAAIYQTVKIPTAPNISVAMNGEEVLLTIDPIDNADGYEIYINGSCAASTSEAVYTVASDRANVGMNEMFVRAYNSAGYSENSNVVTVGKLDAPNYHATGTGIEFIWGDVENAQGYIIYGDDGEYLTTIALGEEYDFSDIYTEDGFYFPYIQAYAEGWISSERQGIPVGIGDNGGPIGY